MSGMNVTSGAAAVLAVVPTLLRTTLLPCLTWLPEAVALLWIMTIGGGGHRTLTNASLLLPAHRSDDWKRNWYFPGASGDHLTVASLSLKTGGLARASVV